MRLNYIDNIDCLEGLRDVPDNSVDLIVTDPPYFLSMGHAGSSSNSKRSDSEMLNSNRTFNDLAICTPFYKQLFAEYRRVLKDDGSFYFFNDWRGYAYYFPLINAELPVRNLIIWDKKSGPGSFYSFAHEFIIFGTRKSKIKKGAGTNVWRMAAFSSGAKSTNGEKVHPTQKPIELITKAIEDATEPGAVVLDTFMGSGTTAVAAIRSGRNFIGFELDEKYHAIAMGRVEDELRQILERQAAGEEIVANIASGFTAAAEAAATAEDEEDWMA